MYLNKMMKIGHIGTIILRDLTFKRNLKVTMMELTHSKCTLTEINPNQFQFE